MSQPGNLISETSQLPNINETIRKIQTFVEENIQINKYKRITFQSECLVTDVDNPESTTFDIQHGKELINLSIKDSDFYCVLCDLSIKTNIFTHVKDHIQQNKLHESIIE